MPPRKTSRPARHDAHHPQKPNRSCQPGDLWSLGPHRLLCGDATNAADVGRVLGGEAPLVMTTDPPYGVQYDPAWRDSLNAQPSLRTGKPLNDDRHDWTEAYKLFAGDVAYVWHAGLFACDVSKQLADAKFLLRSQIIWRKRRFAISRGHYHWQHEPCWYAVRKGHTATWTGDRKQRTVWELVVDPLLDRATVHATQKPVEAMARAMRNHGLPGSGVYDPFLGSGTTLIAAEVVGRTCYALELNPAFCDVAIARWEQHTGRRATRVR